MKYSTSLFRMPNLAHAFITVSSIQNIFVMGIFTSGSLSRIHAPHRIGWPVLTYRLPIALDENIHSIYRLTLKSSSCVIHMSLVALFEWLVLRYFCSIYSIMLRWSHVSKTSDLMLKRDTTSSLNICCDVIRDIVEAWSTVRHHLVLLVTSSRTSLVYWGNLDPYQNWVKPQRYLFNVITADVWLTQPTYWHAIITAYIAQSIY